MTLDDAARVQKRILKNIEENGHTVITVFPTAEEMFDFVPFGYSIGLHLAGLPELLVVLPLRMEMLHSAVNSVATQLRKHEAAFPDGHQLDIGWSTPVRIHEPNNLPKLKERYTLQAAHFLKTTEYRVQQILFPDRDGKWPQQKGYAKGDEAMRQQPLL